MRILFSLALLCLALQQPVTAQTTPYASAPESSYIINDTLLINTRDGAQVSALLVRKKGVQKPLPTILIFTIYARVADIRKAQEAADRGYAGVVAYTRGKRNSPETNVAPYEYDGRDAYDVIDWIAHQSWSNQQVGMYGGSYSGFAQWAATKQLHPALKTIVPSASVAPGLDAPMMNNVIMTFPFSWTYYVSNNKWLDTADYNSRHWNDLLWQWYQEGSSYRSLDSLANRPNNRIFRSWLAHPTYDTYWQNMIPYREEFAHINIPVLTTTGYFDGGQVGATYYFREHLRYVPNAQHYLLIGPYGHFGCQGYPDSVFNNYRIDPSANIPIHEIIYQWFDHIFFGKDKPAILRNQVNYQVMGTNQWKHAASWNTTSNDTLTLYLSKTATNGQPTLSSSRPQQPAYIRQVVDMADRRTVNSYYYINSILYDSLPDNHGIVFKSAPLSAPLELTGCFMGKLSATISKRDIDFSVVLFEQTAKGQYIYLTYFMGRASYAQDHRVRHLLTPGNKTTIPFSNSYMTSRQLQTGSRIVAIVNINKSPFEQINYGTGKDVSSETIRDAGTPLVIKWHNDSFLQLPVWR
ncbi:CocE/NonD family hydrolase [Paraflavitalea pollutisoli]|uniref:CocE/NonD family hydrolase n=1 Tax=Paraflavitalea pollutisoli TaxID=3034143 RepID=UPI0023EE2400|nr:CocE/NonD family hydrolase [Paraflavitalea sp. H1-2-19X]